MTDTTRGRRSLQTIVAVLAVILFGSIFFSKSPAYSSWSLVMLWVWPCAFGAVIAGVLWLSRRGGSAPVRSNRDPFSEDAASDVINMARIRVAGFGGLGMVAVAVVLAIVFPRIGDTLMIGLLGGVLAAGAVILSRRRSGPLASSGKGTGGRSVLVAPDDDEPTPTPRAVSDRQAYRSAPA